MKSFSKEVNHLGTFVSRGFGRMENGGKYNGRKGKTA